MADGRWSMTEKELNNTAPVSGDEITRSFRITRSTGRWITATGMHRKSAHSADPRIWKRDLAATHRGFSTRVRSATIAAAPRILSSGMTSTVSSNKI